MSQNCKIQLDCSSIKKINLDSYSKDFTFIVNGEEYKTSRLISELLSPKIINLHMNDPTIDHFVINTQSRGNFSTILDLVTFKITELDSNSFEFISEVFEILSNESIKLIEPTDVELSTDSVIGELIKREKQTFLYSKLFERCIEYASSHFNELLSSHQEELKLIEVDTLERIISNEHLQLDNENELLSFINELYKEEVKYSILYEYVYFSNVDSKHMGDFVDIYEMKYLNERTWTRLCERLVEEVKKKKHAGEERYTTEYHDAAKEGQIFSPKQEDPFTGIIDHLRNKSNNHIEQEIKATASSIGASGEKYQPQTVLLKENPSYHFHTKNEPGSWLKLDFQEHRIIPTDYTIRSGNSSPPWHHPRSWVIEVSNDDDKWEQIDEVKNHSNLNGRRLVHTFKIQTQQSTPIRYIRLRQTDKTLSNCNNLLFETIEIYGTLI